MRKTTVAVLAAAALPFVAACTSTNAGDVVLTDAELRQLIVGESVSFDGGGAATYHGDGRYEYVLNGTDRGTYSIRANQVCVEFDDGGSRCDSYVQNGDAYFLINGRGDRYRVRIG